MLKLNGPPLVCIFLLLLYSSILANNHLSEGLVLLENKEFDKATSFFSERVKENKKDHEALFYLGRSLMMSGDFNKAIDKFKKAVKLNDKNADYHFWLGAALGTKAQQSSMFRAAFLAPKILKQFERTVELDSTHVNGLAATADFYSMAPSVMGGDSKKARQMATALTKIDAQRGYLVWASIYEREKDYKNAEESYKKYHQVYTDSTGDYTFYNRYGYFLLNRNKAEEAVSMFERQVELAPNEANPYDSLGDGYRSVGRDEDAIKAYEKAVALNPDFEDAKKKLKDLKSKLNSD